MKNEFPEISRSVEHSVILISKAGITRINGRLVSQRGRSSCGDVTGYSGGRTDTPWLAREGKPSASAEWGRMGWEETLAVVACRCSVRRPLWPGPSKTAATGYIF
jgi:hypothetical protein